MIDVRELRIGNYVLRNGLLPEHKEIFNKIIVSHNDITACVVSPKSFKPIPLTEEWLVRFGFEKKYNSYWDKDGIGFIVGYSTDGKLVCGNTFGARHCHYYYVHQMQNVWYFVTNQELTIKE